MTEQRAGYDVEETRKRKLTRKQRVFIDEYLKSFNATQAAIASGYSPKTAFSIGSENLRKPEIAEVVNAHLSASHMSAEEALQRLADIARGDMADLMSLSRVGFALDLVEEDPSSGEIKPKPQTRLIRKIKQKVTTFIAKKESDEDREVVETEIELYNAQDAIDKILRVAGKYIDRNATVDLSQLTNHQLERLSNGDDLYSVLADKGTG